MNLIFGNSNSYKEYLKKVNKAKILEEIEDLPENFEDVIYKVYLINGKIITFRNPEWVGKYKIDMENLSFCISCETDFNGGYDKDFYFKTKYIHIPIQNIVYFECEIKNGNNEAEYKKLDLNNESEGK